LQQTALPYHAKWQRPITGAVGFYCSDQPCCWFGPPHSDRDGRTAVEEHITCR
jgi:hypothetical protein